jgi:CHASE3 domain sensor protein
LKVIPAKGSVMAISPELRKRLEEVGEAQVRLVLNGEGFAPSLHDAAREWLAELDDAQRVRNEANLAKEAQRLKSTVKATWITVYVAVGALVLSIIAIIISVLIWLYPRH